MASLNIADFRAQFTEFSNVTDYPDSMITQFWDVATLYISENDYGVLKAGARQRAIYLMMAHLLKINQNIADGTTNTLLSASTIGAESVTLVPPPAKTQYQWWMNLTLYGQELLNLLSLASVGGFYVGGRPERSGFRKVWGRF